MIAAFLADLRVINFVLLALYAANAARWALHGSWQASFLMRRRSFSLRST